MCGVLPSLVWDMMPTAKKKRVISKPQEGGQMKSTAELNKALQIQTKRAHFCHESATKTNACCVSNKLSNLMKATLYKDNERTG